jgi:DNA-binding MarR family transcriptional regulator
MNDELYEKLTRLQWLLHKQQIRGYAAGGPMADPTRGQGRILAILKMQDGISTKYLSYLLGIRVSSLNETLAKLEKSGHILRESSNDDGRVMLVRLTEKGKNEQAPEMPGFIDIFSVLSEEEQALFGEYLDRIIAALESKLGTDGDEMFERMRAWHSHFADKMEGPGRERFEKMTGKFHRRHHHGYNCAEGFCKFDWFGNGKHGRDGEDN